MNNLAINGGQPVRNKLLPYGSQWIDSEDIEAVVSVLKSDYITQGPNIRQFEQSVAEYVGAKYAVAFSNGTSALHGACFAAGIGPGDEVITTPITFVASSNCVLYQGGTPVFADIDPHTYNISADKLEKCITPRTKAIIPVDFSGQPVELDKIMNIAERNQLTVIHDAAHSIGATYAGRKVGQWADMTMFSFHPVKHVTTGEGGVIVTDRKDLYEQLMLFRNHGVTRDPHRLHEHDGPWYYEMQLLGHHYRMTDMQAALGTSQLRKLDSFIHRRREIVEVYNEAFSAMEGILCPYQHPKAKSSWHLYVIRIDSAYFKADRRAWFEALRAENIGVNVHYIPVYNQPYYQQLGYTQGLCPEAEAYYQQAITLPLFPKMSAQDVKDVTDAVGKIYNAYIK